MLTGYAADLSHPAFHKLFLETEFSQKKHRCSQNDVRATRNKRRSGRFILWLVPRWIVAMCSMNRAVRTLLVVDETVTIRKHLTLARSFQVRPVLYSIRFSRSVPRSSFQPDGSVTLAFSTGVAETREEAMRLADQFHELRNVQRSFELSWAYNQVKLHHLQLSAARSQQCQQLANCLIYPQKNARASNAVISSNDQGVNGLWRHGISGDRPIALVKVEEIRVSSIRAESC